MFYVYEWFIIKTGEIIYVGKGHRNRYKVKKHNRLFNEMIKRFECDSRIIKTFENEDDAFKYEAYRICELKSIGQCACNINAGGYGGDTSWWTEEKRLEYSNKNIMKSKEQRERMSINNPMKNKETAIKVGQKHKRKIVVGDEIYNGLVDVSRAYGKTDTSCMYWLERGYTPDYKPCYYYGDEKPTIKIRSHVVTNKKVIVDGVKYDSVKEGANSIGVSSTKMIKCMKENKPCNGYICKYDNQQPSQRKS